LLPLEYRGVYADHPYVTRDDQSVRYKRIDQGGETTSF